MANTSTRPYTSAWRAVPGSVLFLLAMFPVAIAEMTVLITGMGVGGGLLITLVGLPIL